MPQQVTSFIGRERGLADVRRLLGETRLLTLFGMGGLGKTRMSLQVAADVLDDYPDGVWFVELAAVADPRRAPEAVASVLGVMEEAGRPVIEALVRFVSDRQLLLILDNCEHLIDACAALAKTLLQAGPHIKLLASSREHLRVFGETTYAVPGCRFPTRTVLDARRAAELEAAPFRRACSGGQPFPGSPDNAAVAEICRRLDGIRSLSNWRPCGSRVDRRSYCRAPRRSLRPAHARQPRGAPTAANAARVDRLEHDLLSDVEKTLFARPRCCRRHDARCGRSRRRGTGIDASQVLDLLVALVEKSLVELDAGGERYRLLEIVRQYAQERLEAFGESAATRTRHLGFFLRFAETAQPELWGPTQGRWLQRLDRDRDNFLAALAWCDHAENGAACGLRMVYALQLYWLPRGLIELGYRLTVEALERPAAQSRDLNRSGAQYAASQLGYFMGHYEAAQRHGEECLSIARQFGIKRARRPRCCCSATRPTRWVNTSLHGNSSRNRRHWPASSATRAGCRSR